MLAVLCIIIVLPTLCRRLVCFVHVSKSMVKQFEVNIYTFFKVRGQHNKHTKYPSAFHTQVVVWS